MPRSEEPAFPTPDTYHASGQVQYGAPGLSVRELFTLHAMAALRKDLNITRYAVAYEAVRLADETLAMLARTPDPALQPNPTSPAPPAETE